MSLLAEGAADEDVPALVCGSTGAEAVKLFANTQLAFRVAYFNELDTYCAARGLDTAKVIEGVCPEPRIGGHYNTPLGHGATACPRAPSSCWPTTAMSPMSS